MLIMAKGRSLPRGSDWHETVNATGDLALDQSDERGFIHLAVPEGCHQRGENPSKQRISHGLQKAANWRHSIATSRNVRTLWRGGPLLQPMD